ncbi:MAG: choice-of-anchor W domain-containing protein [Methanosarcinaceae archaeon]
MFCFVLMTVPTASAINTRHLSTDTEMENLLDNLAFVSEVRYGDLGGAPTFERHIHKKFTFNAVHGHAIWVSGKQESFLLDYDPGKKKGTFIVDGMYPMEYTVKDTDGAFTDLFICARAKGSDVTGSRLQVYNLKLNGNPISGYVDADCMGGSTAYDILWIKDISPSIENGFTLEGNFKLEWSGEYPKNSRLTFQAKRTTVGETTQIPEFPSMALPMVAILGLAFVFMRKKE